MFKILAALAVIVGTVSAGHTKKWVKSITNEDAPHVFFGSVDGLQVSFDYKIDWTYGVVYEDARITDETEESTLGFNTQSEITANI
jgi:hypothetical protein